MYRYNKNKYNTCGVSNLKNVFMILMSIAIGNMLAKHFRIEYECLIVSLIYSTLLINDCFLILLAVKSAFIIKDIKAQIEHVFSSLH